LIELRASIRFSVSPISSTDADLRGDGVKDITWINADGQEMSDEAWARIMRA